MKLRKLNRSIHRDLGYFFTAMCIIYGLSGIALNHMDSWNPSYKVINKSFNTKIIIDESKITKKEVLSILENIGVEDLYRQYYFPDDNTLKIFVKGGSAVIKTDGSGILEILKRRPFFYEFNTLHYNSAKKYWTWFSDAFAVSLIIFAFTGLFILKGKHGFRKRGIWFVLGGVIVPSIFIYFII